MLKSIQEVSKIAAVVGAIISLIVFICFFYMNEWDYNAALDEFKKALVPISPVSIVIGWLISFFFLNKKPLPKPTKYNTPPKLDKPLGRKKDLNEIHKLLRKNRIVIVSAEGGIGKTTLAANYFHDYQEHYQNLIWTVAKGGVVEALLSLLTKLKIAFDEKMPDEDRLTLVIDEIEAMDEAVLLVFDNVDTLDLLTTGGKSMSRLSKTKILITSRVTAFQDITVCKIKPLKYKDSIQLFKRHYPHFNSKETPLLKKILAATAHNTLITELFAKQLSKLNNEIKTIYSLQNLLENIQKKGVLSLIYDEKVDVNYQKLKKATPSEIIKAMYDISGLKEDDKQLLFVFSVLPPVFVPKADLDILLTAMEEKWHIHLKTLANEAWLSEDEPNESFALNPVVAETLRDTANYLANDIAPVLAALIDRLDYEVNSGIIAGDRDQNIRMVNYAESIVSFPYTISNESALIYDRLGNYHRTRGNVRKALEYYESYSKLMKELHESHPDQVDYKNNLAISYQNLGETYTSMGDLSKALEYYELLSFTRLFLFPLFLFRV